MRAQPDVALLAPYPLAGERHGGHSGVASYTANLAHALAADGVRVVVVANTLDDCPDEPTEFRDGDVDVVRRYPLGASALPTAAQAVADVGAEVVHLQWELFLYGGSRALPGLFPALMRLRRSDATLVTTMHQVLDPSEIDSRMTALHRIGVPAAVARLGMGSVQHAVHGAADATIVHEQPFQRLVPGSHLIPHGIETTDPIDRQIARHRLGLDDRLVVLCFGFLAPYKGLELVSAAAALTGSDVQVVFAGGEHPRLAAAAEQTGFGDELQRRCDGAARFTGWVADEDVGPWFSAADIALFPYPKPFSASGALALALAHGTPVMLSPALARCVGAPSVLACAMEPVALAGELDRCAADRSLLAERSGWTEVLAAERRWPSVARRHVELYEEVRNGRHPSGRSLRAA